MIKTIKATSNTKQTKKMINHIQLVFLTPDGGTPENKV
jgi:hypothetical protein